MTNDFLNVTADYPNDQVDLIVDQVQQGQFQLVLDGTVITHFTKQQLETSQVRFVQNGSNIAPQYIVGVMDPYFTLPPTAMVNTTFYRQPVITTNQLSINQGQTVVMTSSQLNGIDDYSPSQVIFSIDEVRQGQFQLLPLNTTLKQFTEAQLTAKQVIFSQDGSINSPSYRIGISDPYFSVPVMSPVTTTFYRQPSFIHNQLQILEGETVLITSE